ncbi:MAG TPA: acyl carrier protein [Dehalococcoidia bacterium]|nr:acyl carrier protein [Dehalococcoidia bacterium]
MNTADIVEGRLCVLLTRQLKLEDRSSLAWDVPLSDIGLDSLAMLAFIAGLEREFDISVSDRDYEGLETFGDAVSLVTRLSRG